MKTATPRRKVRKPEDAMGVAGASLPGAALRCGLGASTARQLVWIPDDDLAKLRSDLAAAQRVVGAAKAYQAEYARDCAGNHEPFAARVVNNILAGKGPGDQ